MVVRTRFAPSPTGYMHIGNLRTALYAYCIAKHSQGTFILRIEDTDRKRNVPKSIQVIYDSLKLAGLEYDEGPHKDGGYGPYVQSQRKDQGIYQIYADQLVKSGAAYLIGCHITALKTASTHVNPDPTRTRKLLLREEELEKLVGKVERAGYALVPLDLHLKRGWIKLEVGLAKGKKQYDKRDAEKERDWQRDKQRLLREKQKA